MTDNQIALLFLGLFCAAPLVSAFLDSKAEDLKAYVNKRLAPHGLRLKK